MKDQIIAHAVDPDGIISHALLHTAMNPCPWKRDDKDYIEHHFVDYPDVKKVLESLAQSLSSLPPCSAAIYVADIDLLPEIQDRKIFSALSHNYSYWIDHHANSITERFFLEDYCYKVVLAPNKCAAELVQENFLSFDRYAHFLADIAHAHDFGKGELLPRGNELQDIISSGHDLSVLVMDLMKRKVWNFFGDSELYHPYQEVVSSFRIKKEDAYRRLEDSLERVVIENTSILFAFADHLLYMKDAADHLRAKFGDSADYIVVAYAGKENVMAYGQRSGGKHVVAFCQSMGGGGRGHGGGFLLGHKVTPETYPQDRNYIQERLQQFLATHPK